MNEHRSRIIMSIALLGGLGAALLLLAAAWLLLGPVSTAAAQGDGGTPQATEQPPTDGGSAAQEEPNSYCVICHSQPGRSMTLADGSVLDLYVSPQVIADSVHGTGNPMGPLGCVDCHGENVFPHSGPPPASARVYRIQASQACTRCHNELLGDSAHLEAIERGNLNAATCVDCHRAHDTPATEDQPTLVSSVCGDCHTASYTEWAESPHAEMGSLGCAVCHLPHGQQLRIENTTALCLNCHKVPGDIYVHAKHLEQTDYDVTCASCHMAFDPTIKPMSGDTEPTDHRMVVATKSCNECHQELENSGVWAQITDTNEEVAIERDALRQQVSELEQQVSKTNTSSREGGVDYVQLIQGLIVGLGVGVIIVLIVVPRLNRANNGSVEEEVSDEEGNEEEHGSD